METKRKERFTEMVKSLEDKKKYFKKNWTKYTKEQLYEEIDTLLLQQTTLIDIILKENK